MTRTAFRKTLSANDVGTTGGHQGGMLIPKGERELLDFLPRLDASMKNPDAWIECFDIHGNPLRFRFVYYNNKLHDVDGTRNEYRIMHMTAWFRQVGARTGDIFEIAREGHAGPYTISVLRGHADPNLDGAATAQVVLRGWRRVH